MGAEVFEVTWIADSPEDAFSDAVRHHQWEYGHGGYTGTIAEKSSFVLRSLPGPGEINPDRLVDALVGWDELDRMGKEAEIDHLGLHPPSAYVEEFDSLFEIFDDKWGPALAFDLGNNRYLFCGWASS